MLPLPPGLAPLLTLAKAPEAARARFRARVSGDPSGAPDWVRDIASVGAGDGWFSPDGVVWAVHGDLATLVGGVAALLGQAAHPLALAGVERHSAYRQDPWKRLAGTARWLVISSFGSAALAEREAARVRTLHTVVRGVDDHGRAYSASDPALLRWVHLAFTDAFLAAQQAVGHDLRPRFGTRWADEYVRDWQRSAAALGATDLPSTEAELAEALSALVPQLEPVPSDLRRYLARPPGLGLAEQLFYTQLAVSAELLLSPSIAPLAGAHGRSRRTPQDWAQLHSMRAQLRALGLVLGGRSPSEEAARFRLGLAAEPAWIEPEPSSA